MTFDLECKLRIISETKVTSSGSRRDRVTITENVVEDNGLYLIEADSR